MRRAIAVFLMTSSAVLLSTIALPAQGQIADTQINLSCNDGHSVNAAVDPTTLLELQSEVQALSNDPSGVNCSLDPASPPAASWTAYDYNPSGRAISPRVSPGSQPATNNGGTVSFPFILNTYTALLTTTDESLTGNLSAKTLQVIVSVAGGAGTFQDQNNGGCIPDNKSVRFYFTSPKASGTTGPGTTGFYTKFWWSNPISVSLFTDPQGPMTITQTVNSPGLWSDWNGQTGDSSTEVLEAFEIAIQNVQTVGLSFGGGCFFENGVTTSDGQGTFMSTFTAN
jgi:hypothetical protein